MNVYQSIESYISKRPSVVTIGTFDGMHIGHRKIVSRLMAAARDNDLDSLILTFFPHPRMVLQKENGIRLINTIGEREVILSKTGLDHLVIHPFTKEFSRLDALEFVRDLLVNKLNVKKIIIGYDHRFGRNRTADITDLRELSAAFGFEVEEIPAQQVDEVAVSSTKIRNALAEGDVRQANEYLGDPFILTGRVVRGKGIGKTIGYPTANLHIAEAYKLIPKNGVYIVRSIVEGETVCGMMNIGVNPTVGGTGRTIEAHFFDLDKDLYDTRLQIDLLARIRDEEKFDSLESLREAIREDETVARKYVRRQAANSKHRMD